MTTKDQIEALGKAELLPCPFCGKQPQSQWVGDSMPGGDCGFWNIECCYAVVTSEDGEEDAAKKWNTRVANLKGEQPCADCEFGYCMNPAHEATPKPAPEPQDYERLRLAFEGYIRDRRHRVELTDADVKAEMDEWMAVAEDVEDVK